MFERYLHFFIIDVMLLAVYTSFSLENMTDNKMKLYIRRGLNVFPIFKTLTGKRIIRIKKIKNEHYN